MSPAKSWPNGIHANASQTPKPKPRGTQALAYPRARLSIRPWNGRGACAASSASSRPSVGLRAVTSTDGMTADFYPFDMAFIGVAATRIVNEVKGVNRVVYDVTSKPPGTIEWE